MYQRPIVAAVAVALFATAFAPVPAASAADAAVSGVVSLDGAPVPAVEVGWFDPASGASGETVTAADGSYSVVVASGHPYVLYAGLDHSGTTWKPVTAASFTGVFTGANGADTMFQSLAPFAATDVAVAGQNLALGHPGSITGTHPGLANKKIKLVSLVNVSLATTQADAAGRFAFSGLIPGRYRVKALSTPGKYAPYVSPELTVTAGGTTTVDPALTKTGTITGTLTFQGKPVTKIQFYAICGDYSWYGKVDSRGRFTFPKIPAGDCRLVFGPGGDDSPVPANQPYLMKTVKVHVTAGKTTKLAVKLRPGGTVTGTLVPSTGAKYAQAFVLDKHDKAVGGAYVELKGSTPVSLSIEGVVGGHHRLVVVEGRTFGKPSVYSSQNIVVHRGSTRDVGRVAPTTKTLTLRGKVSGVKKGYLEFLPRNYVLGASAVVRNGSYVMKGIVPASGTLTLHPIDLSNKPYFSADGTYRLSITKSRSKNVAPDGPLYARFAGSFTAGGWTVPEIAARPHGPDGCCNFISVRNGVMDGAADFDGTRTYAIDQGKPALYGFVSGAPFWVSLPPDKTTFVTKRGTTTDIGIVPLVINR